MGVFGFFNRRRERESAVPGSSPDSVTRSLKGDGQPVGQQVQGVGQPAFDLTALGSVTGAFSMLGDIQQLQQGFQVTQAPVIDARGVEGLREEILIAMRQHGIDPDDPQSSQVNAADMPGLQAQIMQALQNHGIDAGQAGAGGITIEGGESEGDSGGAGS